MLKLLIIVVTAFVAFEVIEHLVVPIVGLILKRQRKSWSGAEGMVGKIGEVREWDGPEGKVFIHGEIWNAVSEASLTAGDKAVVRSVAGLTLHVVPEDALEETHRPVPLSGVDKR